MAIHIHGEYNLESQFYTDEIDSSIELLLNFEEISYEINNVEERNKFYIAVTFSIGIITKAEKYNNIEGKFKTALRKCFL